ncbi:hypothetical protein FNF27_03986 [Cafeteria roenbergensis]|uniref:BRO1 domain-containing protein n=2 Tax=Cafeteria roenbergensis TaxID=33653 RepID=A0A5A8EFN5_CAFRO|nr:hypothetical protein FNF27_03986 [Cafeteria roenbergensis]
MESREHLIDVMRTCGAASGRMNAPAQCEAALEAACAHARAVAPLAADEAASSARGENAVVVCPVLVWAPALVSPAAARPRSADSPWKVASWAFDAMMTALLVAFLHRERAVCHVAAARALAKAPGPDRTASGRDGPAKPGDWSGLDSWLRARSMLAGVCQALGAASRALREAAGVFGYCSSVLGPLLEDAVAPRTHRGQRSVSLPPDAVPSVQAVLAKLSLAECAGIACHIADATGKPCASTARLWAGAAETFRSAQSQAESLSEAERRATNGSLLRRPWYMASWAGVRAALAQAVAASDEADAATESGLLCRAEALCRGIRVAASSACASGSDDDDSDSDDGGPAEADPELGRALAAVSEGVIAKAAKAVQEIRDTLHVAAMDDASIATVAPALLFKASDATEGAWGLVAASGQGWAASEEAQSRARSAAEPDATAAVAAGRAASPQAQLTEAREPAAKRSRDSPDSEADPPGKRMKDAEPEEVVVDLRHEKSN